MLLDSSHKGALSEETQMRKNCKPEMAFEIWGVIQVSTVGKKS